MADDDHNPDAATEIGGWGPWINGGAWLHCAGAKVDILYRDTLLVEQTIANCRAGRVRTEYQEGHPYAFHSHMLAGEAHYNRPLWDPDGIVSRLRAETNPYPDALAHAIVNRFLPEAEFTRTLIAQQASRVDAYYSAGLHFRLISCLVQTIFAANRAYFLNEKGSLRELMDLRWTPAEFMARADALIRGHLERRLDAIGDLVSETRAIVADLAMPPM
ncbi:MAG TPA: DNA polymerase subunit beta [Candidatus Dormibacteraeota bacterium]